MKSSNWIFEPRLVLMLVAIVAACELIMHATDLHLLGLPTPGASSINHRLQESLILWIVVCLGVGWSRYFFNRRPERDAKTWPVSVIPLIVALWLAGSRGWEALQQYVALNNGPSGASRFWLNLGVPLALAGFPLIIWVMIAWLLSSQAKIWRNPVKIGYCPCCDYDLTGNQSGSCPECGTPIVIDPEIPYYLYARTYRMTPELGEFPDAKARHDASKRASEEFRRSRVSRLFTLLWLISIALLIAAAIPQFGNKRWMALFLSLGLTGIILWQCHRSWRTSLRRQLKERGGK